MEVLKQRLARIAVALTFVLSGCSLTGLDYIVKPSVENEAGAQVKAKDPAGAETERMTATSSPLASQVRLSSSISGFRSATVILYSTAVGSDGVRLSAATLATPLAILASSPDGRRLQISTVEGPRWIAASDVIFGDSAAAPAR